MIFKGVALVLVLLALTQARISHLDGPQGANVEMGGVESIGEDDGQDDGWDWHGITRREVVARDYFPWKGKKRFLRNGQRVAREEPAFVVLTRTVKQEPKLYNWERIGKK